MIKLALLATARTGHGGTLLYTQSMIEALGLLPKDQFKCTIFTAADNHEYDDLCLPIVRFPSGRFATLLAGLKGILFEDSDIVLAPVYSPYLLLSHTPFVFTLHDLQEKYYPEYFTFLTRLWRDLMNRLLTHRARRILCESSFVKGDIARYFNISHGVIDVVPAPPVAALMDTPSLDAVASVRARFDLPEVFLFYPAQFWPHKNHIRLIEAFRTVNSAFPDCHLVLTGKARDEYKRVFNRVRELGLEEKVHHIGYVENSDLIGLYRGARVVVIPTLFESISIPVFEAFAIGTPVCASNVVALPEQIGEAGLLFDPCSVNDIAATVIRLLSDEPLRERLVACGRERVRAVSQPLYAQGLQAMIQKALSLEISPG